MIYRQEALPSRPATATSASAVIQPPGARGYTQRAGTTSCRLRFERWKLIFHVDRRSCWTVLRVMTTGRYQDQDWRVPDDESSVETLRGLLKRERRPVTPGPHALAVRAGVLQ
jgi:hypothetical protein